MGIWEDFFERAKSFFGTTNPSNMGVFEEFFEKAKTLFGESESGAVAPKKRCYYELLEVDRDATEDEIKKSYKKLALKWHPDKNPDKQEECAAYFVLLQQAYEVLVDPQERAFYDKHRENILHGGESAEESRDEGISLYPFFSTCYKGFNDEKEGFYAVYRELFDKLSAEEYAYLDEDERDFPSLGKSDSDYEKIVYKFYAFWMDFHTSRSFAWLDKYDLRQAPDRRTLRAMEKENEKLREVGRKKRNEEIQELVMYVRKRDPRVKRYRETLEKRRQEQLQRVEQIRRQQLKENLEKLGEYVVDEDAHQAHLEALDEIENALDAEFGTIRQKVAAAGSDVSDEEDEEENYCVACEKAFKSSKAYSNHQKSKKHKQTVEELKKFMKEEDAVLILGDEPSNFNDAVDEEIQQVSSKSKKKRKKQRENANEIVEDTKENENEPNLVEEMEKVEIKEATEQGEKPTKKEKRKMKQKEVAAPSSSQPVLPVKPTGPVESNCDNCGETFDSRSKLFKHLELTGHATLKSPIGNSSGNKNKKKGKK